MKTNRLKKKVFFVLLALFCVAQMEAQWITVTTPSATQLKQQLLDDNVVLSDVVNLKIVTSGTTDIEAADFATMRNDLPNLKQLDLSGAKLRSNQIPANAFYVDGTPNTTLESVVFPESLAVIESRAFRGCTKLGPVVDLSGTNIQNIKGEAFWGTSSMTTILLNNTLTELGGSVFRGGSAIERLDLSETGVSVLSGNMFEGATSLSEVLLPSTLEEIGGNVFYGCTSFSSLVIPASVTVLADNIFNNTSPFTSITVVEDEVNYPNPSYFTISDAALFSNDDKRLIFYASGSSVTQIKIPEGILSIAGGIFKNNSTITEIDLPSTLTSIDGGAIATSSSFTKLICRAPVPPICALGDPEGVFWNTPRGIPVFVPNGTIALYEKNVAGWTYFDVGAYVDNMMYKVTVDVTNGTTSLPYAIVGETVEITAPPTGGGKYLSGWISDPVGAVTFDSSTPETSFTMTGQNVTVTPVYDGTTVGLEESKVVSISIYPNPTVDVIYVKGLDANVGYKIVDVMGRVLLSDSNYNGESINVASLPAGVYLLQSANAVVKFIKK